MNHCKHCGKPLPAPLPSCPYCGAQQAAASSAPPQAAGKRRSKALPIILVLLLIIIAGGTVAFLKWRDGKSPPGASQKPQTNTSAAGSTAKDGSQEPQTIQFATGPLSFDSYAGKSLVYLNDGLIYHSPQMGLVWGAKKKFIGIATTSVATGKQELLLQADETEELIDRSLMVQGITILDDTLYFLIQLEMPAVNFELMDEDFKNRFISSKNEAIPEYALLFSMSMQTGEIGYICTMPKAQICASEGKLYFFTFSDHYVGVMDPETDDTPRFVQAKYPLRGRIDTGDLIQEFRVENGKVFYIAMPEVDFATNLEPWQMENKTTPMLCRVNLQTGETEVLLDAYRLGNFSKGILYRDTFYMSTPFFSVAMDLGITTLESVSLVTNEKTVLYTGSTEEGTVIPIACMAVYNNMLYFTEDKNGFYAKIPLDGSTAPQPAFSHPDSVRNRPEGTPRPVTDSIAIVGDIVCFEGEGEGFGLDSLARLYNMKTDTALSCTPFTADTTAKFTMSYQQQIKPYIQMADQSFTNPCILTADGSILPIVEN